MGLKPKENNSGSKVDWAKVNAQLTEDSHEARIVAVVDLGTQQRTPGVFSEENDKKIFTYVATEEEAIKVLADVSDLVSDYIVEKEGYEQYEEIDVDDENFTEIKKFIPDVAIDDVVIALPFRIKERSDAHEVAYYADLVEHYVEYIEGEDPKQFRVQFNQRDYQTGDMRGTALITVPPKTKDSKFWTFSPLSLTKKLADAAGVDFEEYDNDVEALVGKPIYVAITKNKNGYPKFTPSMIPAKYRDAVPESDCTPMLITFEDATVEQLEEFKPNRLLIDKIKKAVNYEGSQMQKAVEEYEAKFKKGSKDSENEGSKAAEKGGQGDSTLTSKASRRTTKSASKTAKKSTSASRKKVKEEIEDDEPPFDTDEPEEVVKEPVKEPEVEETASTDDEDDDWDLDEE